MEILTVKAKDLSHKPTVEEELNMAIGMCMEKIAEFELHISELTKKIEELQEQINNMRRTL